MPFGGLLTLGGVALANVGGAVIGNMASAADRDAAAAAQQRALAEIEKLGAGPDLAKQIFFREFELAGVLTPELEREVEKGVSKVAQIQEDPRLKKAQMEALVGIQARGRTGFTAEEAVRLRQERAAAERSAESKRQQILAGLRARGALDSGAGVAAQLQSADELAAQQLEASDRASAMADQRALQSMMQGAHLSGQIRGQEFSQSERMAAAEDAMNIFNIGKREAQEARRVETENRARQFNLANKQSVSDRNREREYQEALRRNYYAPMQMRQDAVNLAGMRSNALLGQAQQYRQQAGQTQQGFAQMGSALGGAIGAVGQYAMNAPLRDAQMGYYNRAAGVVSNSDDDIINDPYFPFYVKG